MSDNQLKAIVMAPGLNLNTTEYAAEGRWVDSDKIRFRNSRPEKIGGFVSETVSQVNDASNTKFTGVARAIKSWNDLNFNKYLAVASHLKVELLNDNQIYDITPVRESPSLTDVITTVNTETEVTINDVNHSLAVDDYVFVNSQGSAVDGITLSGSYQVTEVVDSDNYKIDSGVAATGSTSNGGGSLDIDYLLENGVQSNGDLTGYSGGTWNTPGASGQGYNRPRSGVGGLNLRQWSLDLWGEDLIACVRQGKLYQWDATNGVTTRLQQITNAPEENLFVLVSQPSRHLVAFGSEIFSSGDFDPLIIRWASQESLTDWDITDTNSAGEFRLPNGNFIVCAVQTRSDIIVFTDTSAYSMRYVGGNQVFRFEPLGTNISIASQHAAIDLNGTVMWQGIDNFYIYDGVIRTVPTAIAKHLFDQDGNGRINESQKEKTFLGVIKEFNEVIGFYPSLDSEECNVYWKYNYIEDVFDIGTFDRTVWLDRSIFNTPYAISSDGTLYAHEQGKDADGDVLEAFIKSADFDLEDGQQLIFIDRIVPDIKLPENRNIEIRLFLKKYPNPNTKVQTKGPYFFDSTKDKISMRARARQMSVEYRSNATGGDFEIGKFRFGIQPDGER